MNLNSLVYKVLSITFIEIKDFELKIYIIIFQNNFYYINKMEIQYSNSSDSSIDLF